MKKNAHLFYKFANHSTPRRAIGKFISIFSIRNKINVVLEIQISGKLVNNVFTKSREFIIHIVGFQRWIVKYEGLLLKVNRNQYHSYIWLQILGAAVLGIYPLSPTKAAIDAHLKKF